MVTVARKQMHNYGCYTATWYDDMEIRYFNPFLHLPGCMTYRIKKYVPQIKYAKSIPNPGWEYPRFLSVIINPEAETIYKAGYENLSRVFPERIKQIKKLWPATKVCIRNKYPIDDPLLWLDYVDSLRFFKKDIHNRHYVCPADLQKSYQRWYNRKKAILEDRNPASPG